ncbi:MAG: CpsD/CapB family tyrosine-protein kinase, partial [Clostridiales bacterium]|nr:CpsD/CapB family tyrosine-protein kinase [Clostridiales bacterium]
AYDILQSVIENYPQAASYIVGNIEFTVIDESGVPASAYNAPDYRSAMKRGAAGGACVFVLVLLVYALSRNTVRREEDLERRSSMECLGKVPKMKHKKRSGKKQQTILLDQREISGAMGECFRTIRTRVVKNCENLDAHSVLVTSTTEGEGKTTIAVNLALSLAKRGLKVVLVDADLRRPSVAGALGMGQPEKGLKDVLSGNAKISETLVACDGGLFVLPGTGSIQEPSRLLGSSRMDSVLHALTKAADYVVVDSPPCGMLSDAALLARKIDSIVMVVK